MRSDQSNQMHGDDKRNLIIFFAAVILIWMLFDNFFFKPNLDAQRAHQRAIQEAALHEQVEPESLIVIPAEQPRSEAVSEGRRVRIDNGRVFGSINLTGGRIDDLSLQEYFKDYGRIDHVNVLSPAGTPFPKYAEFGWIASSGSAVPVPGRNTNWQVVETGHLGAGDSLTLFWDNGQGQRFERVISLDEHFMFTVTQRVINNSAQPVTLYPYGLLSEHGLPEDLLRRAVIHEGPIGYIGGDLTEYSYRKASREVLREDTAREGWIGITQNYWLTALIPAQDENTKFRFVYTPPRSALDKERFQVDIMGQPRTIAANGGVAESVTHAYLGAKIVNLIGRYERELGIRHFDLTINFGLFYFLTKPLYYILTFLGGIVGNFGVAIIILTVLIRIAVFPLANTSFKSFAKLKKISPMMKELRDKYGEDKEKLQQELVKLYEKEKVNPMAGCLPILIQIPIFFALFKVLQLSIEMRHAPFFGWIKDLSARDPTSVFNLFGLLPYSPPDMLMIGIWPCLMLVFMIIQKKMNPPPQDKTQAMMMNLMPYIITYILAKFPAGLVIYWTFSNALSVVQQYVIMRSMGVEVHWFKRPEGEKELEKAVAKGPAVHPELGVIEDEVEKALFDEKTEAEKAEEAKPVSPPKKKKSKKKK